MNYRIAFTLAFFLLGFTVAFALLLALYPIAKNSNCQLFFGGRGKHVLCSPL